MTVICIIGSLRCYTNTDAYHLNLVRLLLLPLRTVNVCIENVLNFHSQNWNKVIWVDDGSSDTFPYSSKTIFSHRHCCLLSDFIAPFKFNFAVLAVVVAVGDNNPIITLRENEMYVWVWARERTRTIRILLQKILHRKIDFLVKFDRINE